MLEIQALQKEVKRLHRLVVVMFVVVGVSSALSAALAIGLFRRDVVHESSLAVNGLVKAQGFVIVDPDGERRADFGLTDPDRTTTSRLRLFDANGVVRFSVGATKEGCTLGLLDAKQNAIVAVTEKNIAFVGPDRTAVTMGMTSAGGAIAMRSATGNSITLGCGDDVAALGIVRQLALGSTSIVLNTETDGQAQIKVNGIHAARTNISVGTDGVGEPFLKMSNTDGKTRTLSDYSK